MAEAASILDSSSPDWWTGPLLSTKLYIPPARPNLVSRERLLERLDRAQGSRLVLLSAGAGFGKTTLLCDWVRRSRLPFAWLSLDGRDNDPVRFWAYFIAAIQRIHPGVGEEAMALLHTPQPPRIESLLTLFINELAKVSQLFTLLLDDYHLIESPAVHSSMEFLLDHQPSQMRLIIASREDPPLPLAKWRARGELVELRAEDLRFTAEEAPVFLNQTMGLGLSAEQVETLETKTEGWIAGLQLAALSLQQREDNQEFIATFAGSGHYLLHYLGEEVLDRQPEEVRRFLLRTSIVDRLTAPLCDAITGESNGSEMLERLDHSNLFTVPLDGERHWYRYHNLFAEFLRDHLGHEESDLVPTLHRRACDWFKRNGLLPEAVAHALAAADFDRAAHLIGSIALSTLMQGEVATLENWLKALPERTVCSHPRVCLAHAWILAANTQVEAAEARLREAERLLNAAPPDSADQKTRNMLVELLAVRAILAAFKLDGARAMELARQALDQMPADEPFLNSIVALSIALAHEFSGDAAVAGQAYLEASRVSQAVGNSFVNLLAIGQLADQQAMRGDLRGAARSYRRGLQMAAERGWWPLAVAGIHIGLGRVLLEWNDLDAAERHLHEGIEIGNKHEVEAITLFGTFVLAQLRQAQGDMEGALDAIHKAGGLAPGIIPMISNWAAAYEARLWLAKGNLAAAARQMEQMSLRADDHPGYLHEFEHIVLARVLIAEDRLDEALGLLGRLLAAADAASRNGSAIEILVLRALALQTKGDPAGAVAALEQALSLAEPGCYLRTFVSEGAPMAALLARVLRTLRKSHPGGGPAVSRDYVARLLVALERSGDRVKGEQDGGSVPTSIPSIPMAEPLSSREVEVLRLLANGMSDREIACELFVTVGTVKRHNHSIYGKLGVRDRTQATARARDLNLLSQ